MAPNNRETRDGRLRPWWDAIGEHLDKESSLVFWLSGTFENQQYPITGGSAAGTIIAAHSFGGDTLGPRRVYFDFQNGQFFGDTTDETVEDSSGSEIPLALRATAAAPGVILEYMQPHGKSMGIRPSAGSDLLFKYLDSTSYPTVGAYFDVGGDDYINPKTFQLITFGLDGEPGAPPTNLGTNSTFGISASASDNSFGGEDNLCHFANGRIRLWLIANGQ